MCEYGRIIKIKENNMPKVVSSVEKMAEDIGFDIANFIKIAEFCKDEK